MAELEVYEEKDTVYWNKNRKTVYYRYYGLDTKLAYRITHSAFSNKFVAKFASGEIIGQYDTHDEALNSFTQEI